MAEEEAKERMGAIARIRAMLLGEGISFYDLEEKASPDEFFESPAKSLARWVMRREGISVQHLKKGTIALENKGNLTKQDIEKHVKAMAALKRAVYNYDGDRRSADCFSFYKSMASSDFYDVVAMEREIAYTLKDTEKHVADLEKHAYYGGDERRSSDCFSYKSSLAEDAMEGQETMYGAAGANINGIILSEEALKDMEMPRDDLITKRMKKLAKIEKKKMLKLKQKMMKMQLAEHKAHSTTS